MARREYVTYDGRSLSVCTECGTVVQYARRDAHSAFHKKIQELLDQGLSLQDMLPPF